MGPLTIWPPRLTLQSNSPVRALRAWKNPSRTPVNRTSEAVVRIPLSVTSVDEDFHFCSPVRASMAINAPEPAVSVLLLMGPRRIDGTPGAPGTRPEGLVQQPPKFRPSWYCVA